MSGFLGLIGKIDNPFAFCAACPFSRRIHTNLRTNNDCGALQSPVHLRRRCEQRRQLGRIESAPDIIRTMHRPDAPPPLALVSGQSPATPASPTAEWFDFLVQLHASLALDEVAAVIVNELRRLLVCDRVGLLLVTRGRAELLAASGQESFDRRSNVARAWESFTEAVAALDEPFWYDETPTGRAPQIETALQHMLDVSPARYSAVIPLRGAKREDERSGATAKAKLRAGDPVGWLIVERFEQPASDGLGSALAPAGALRERLEMIAPHAGAALDNARRYDRLPLRRLGEKLENVSRGRFGSRWWKWGAIPLLLVAAGLLIPTELKIEARGKLQPAKRSNVFAPVDGIVTGTVQVRHGSIVAAGADLLTLHSPELEFELARVDGELETAKRRRKSLEAARLNRSRSGSAINDPEQIRLAADEEEALQQVDGLEKQLTELKNQMAALVVKSPRAGQVLTWDVEQSLAARPVHKGQLLLSIGDVAGDINGASPWELELQVPDDRIGYVKDAERAAKEREPAEKVVVEFVSASAPQTVYKAALRETAQLSEAQREGEATVRVLADVDVKEMPRAELRPGAVVVAKVHCGRTSLARSWLLDLIHVVRKELLF